jgi:hypothetical protein
MKFFTITLAVALLVAKADATSIQSMKHHHHQHHHNLVQTLPDEREPVVSEADIASKEAARAKAAEVTKNPQASLLASIKKDLDEIDKNVSFGVSFSQGNRNDKARQLCVQIGDRIKSYATNMVTKIEAQPIDALTEQNASNIATLIFYDVQLQDYMGQLNMGADTELNLAVNRLKSLQKLYLFEQKGGENYLD